MPDFGTPSHIDLSVSDAESSARWYCDVLGLRRVRRADFENRIMIVLVHLATGLVIGLNQHASVPVARFDDRNVGLDHIGFSVAERADLDAWEEQLTALGVVHSPAQDTSNGAALVFRDPDNIQLEFWWTRPRRIS
ncbi:VOC family protein [Paeniglutamicibacter psychrophenolicus]|uniref:VOC family protein n=1 Tax=Paeniglutamicibacter psychrophenolicus TaxID=257454 RepID=UPI00277FB8E4|nr:VOC family protein [Paeniglutamicibacter psychrophenolicus]MDQ0094516.1 catechol 2,3-dioxygenase-like lactoylglutathione lyase family enzyme [Paeniglutamicibacter psychrophenolicus]